VRTTNKNLYFGCNLSKSKKLFYREMAILFPVKREMAILFFVKRDPDPPLPPSLKRNLPLQDITKAVVFVGNPW